MQSLQPVIKTILGKNELADCGLSELQSLAKQYPYFAPVHVLLAEKIRSLDENLYKQQLEKVSLYIQNPLWLHYLLNEGTFHREAVAPTVVTELRGQQDEQTAIEQSITEDSVPVTSVDSNNGTIIESIETGTTESLATPPDENKKVDSLSEEINNAGEEESVLPVQEHFTIPVEEEMDADAATSGTDDSEFKIPSLKIEPLKGTKNDFLFEPYHTVDYFASQGIKNAGEEIPRDKFGVQLKSFTDWLKSMKKLPANELEQQMDQGSETKVQSLANHSISQNEIVTETMAEVWLKQGDMAKAREIYQKLSLQNPSKSHYFAAKIESLKTN